MKEIFFKCCIVLFCNSKYYEICFNSVIIFFGNSAIEGIVMLILARKKYTYKE